MTNPFNINRIVSVQGSSISTSSINTVLNNVLSVPEIHNNLVRLGYAVVITVTVH